VAGVAALSRIANASIFLVFNGCHAGHRRVLHLPYGRKPGRARDERSSLGSRQGAIGRTTIDAVGRVPASLGAQDNMIVERADTFGTDKKRPTPLPGQAPLATPGRAFLVSPGNRV
jgi:hypothetical protein